MTEKTVKAITDLAVVGVATGLTLRVLDKSLDMSRSGKKRKYDIYKV